MAKFNVIVVRPRSIIVEAKDDHDAIMQAEKKAEKDEIPLIVGRIDGEPKLEVQ